MYRHTFSYYLIEEYIEIKKDVLKKIKQVSLKKDKHNPEMNLNSYYEAMDNTDESIVFKEFINKQLKDIFEKHNLKLKNCWVQKYLKNSYHSVHTHNPKGKSFVWFIEGNKDSSPLCFYDVGYPTVDVNKNIVCEFDPGKLIIFPGYMPHEVRPNKNNIRLIVSGNLDEL